MISDQQTIDSIAASPRDFVELAQVSRGGLIESWHRGVAVITDPEGNTIVHKGNAKRLIYPRSAIKPLQTVAMIRAGLDLNGQELTITSASHRSTPKHIEIVRSILDKAGLPETALQCPDGIQYNCSGKHAGFLYSCGKSGWEIANYLSMENPMQKLVVEVLQEFASERILKTTVDGCGAPLHAMTVEGIARAIGKFTLQEKSLVDNLTANGWVISNHGVPDAILLEHGFIAKNGAEGVFVVGTRAGYGICIKIADGNLRAAPLVAIKLMLEHELIDIERYLSLKALLAVPSLGGGMPQGEIEAL
ncbi:MAG: asparaginase [Rhodoluna sp.]|jgi:L-asparaginase II